MNGVLVSGFAVVGILVVKLAPCTIVGVGVPPGVSAACVVEFSSIDVTAGGVSVVTIVGPDVSGASEGISEVLDDICGTPVAPGGVCVPSGPVLPIGVVSCSSDEFVLPSVGLMLADVSASAVTITGDSSASICASVAGVMDTFDADGNGTARFLTLCPNGELTEGPPAAKLLPCSSGIAAASA